MKNKELFDRTIAILVKAYQQDTLMHTNCYACAVGNIVAGNMNIGYEKCNNVQYRITWDTEGGGYMPQNTWLKLFNSGPHNQPTELQRKLATEQINSTGYTIEQLKKIEEVFENECQDDDDDFDGYKGLMAVVDILMKIHKAAAKEITEAKSLFIKA